MIYLSCQPAIPRYTWEVEVYIENFLRMGVSPQQIHCVNGLDISWKEVPEDWRKLQKKFTGVNFWFYYDTRERDNTYPPSLQAHLLEKHWIMNPHLKREAVFFHDADFIFTKPMDFLPYLQDDFWYLSDTISYIGGEYIRSKGERVLDRMCEVAEIDKQLVLDNQQGSGGAQKLIKGVNAQYWKNVYELSMKFWHQIPLVSAEIKKEYEQQGKHYHELQHWTMSMWSELWCGWKMGKVTKVVDEFKFMFATNRIEDWEEFTFFHNAGILHTQQNSLFFKGKYDSKLPYGDLLPTPNKTLASYKYYEWIQEVGKTSCLVESFNNS